MPNTSQGKAAAEKALAARRKANKDENWAKLTAQGYAGSPMYFGCISCNGAIIVPESYTSRPKLCSECYAMKDMGWELD